MQTLRRAAVAMSATLLVALFVRLRGFGGTPPRRGGWQELPVSELE